MTTTISGISHLLGSKGNAAIYIFNRNRLIDNYEAITAAFTAKYTNFKIAYSFKTNYLKEIVTTVQSLGALAEVVSPYELQYAQALKFAPSATVYNGVIPDLEHKYYIAANHGIVNIDCYEEFAALLERAEKRHELIRLGLRVSLDVGNGVNSRFGVDPDGEEFQKIMQEIRDGRYVELDGFQCHIGAARPVRYWKEKTLKLIDLLQKYGGHYADFSGVMFGPMPESLAKQFSDYPASFQPYAEVTAGLLKEAFPDERVKMIVEPGTALVGNTMDVLASVKSIKVIRGMAYITVDCCLNQLGLICNYKDIPFEIIQNGDRQRIRLENATIVGNTCIEYDYIRKGMIGELGVGDFIRFENLGAYSISTSRSFIVPPLDVVDEVSRRQLTARADRFYMFQESHWIKLIKRLTIKA